MIIYQIKKACSNCADSVETAEDITLVSRFALPACHAATT